MITETEDVARALDDAAERWPEDRLDRKKLLSRLVDRGHQVAMIEQERRQNITRTSGALTGSYGDDYLANLREDWPE